MNWVTIEHVLLDIDDLPLGFLYVEAVPIKEDSCYFTADDIVRIKTLMSKTGIKIYQISIQED